LDNFRDVADLIQKNRSALRELEFSLLALLRPIKSAALLAEQIAV
jgi:hypothetical protein